MVGRATTLLMTCGVLLAALATPVQAEGTLLASANCASTSASGRANGPMNWASATMKGATTDSGEVHDTVHSEAWAKGTGGGMADAVMTLGVQSVSASCEYGRAGDPSSIPAVGCQVLDDGDNGEVTESWSLAYQGWAGTIPDGSKLFVGTESDGQATRPVTIPVVDDVLTFAEGLAVPGGPPQGFATDLPIVAQIMESANEFTCSVTVNATPPP